MPWKRRSFTGGTLERARNIADLRELAQVGDVACALERAAGERAPFPGHVRIRLTWRG